ncbi:carbon monoxide dehydrogenase subunit G [Pararhizobium sp. IMCC21322]|uniref:SRPBCC family protein n=1 Tax=Pararhizobium sp. IMCC21322 TaxID=3067903 RepID=UPI0027407CDB|nr:carbon monoxide dehydrogenase subunit G [Pararhizobium sp. IMCC21322]
MDMSGEYRIPAPRETVWEAINDPDVLKECIPGCESLEKTSDTEMAAQVTAKVGPIKAKFKGTVTLSDLDPPKSYKIIGEGKGGAVGFAKGGADIFLAEEGNETILTYTAEAQVGGKLAQLGSRLVDGAAKKMADEFFGNLAAKLGSVPSKEADQPSDPDIGHGDNITDVAREIGEAVQDAEEALEVEAGKGTLGGPMMWGLITLAVLIAVVLVLS